jgi:hypothetical protein
MRYLYALSLLFIAPCIATAGDMLTPRPLDPVAADTFVHAQRSALVRSLVAVLEGSNVVVHIVAARQMPAGIGGTTRFVTSRGGYRYVRITIGADLTLRVRSAILGHELQHACEVANSTASDPHGIRELFQRQGHRSGDYFETRAALHTESIVRGELRQPRQASPPRQALPPPGK